MKNESENRVSTDTIPKPTAPLITNYKQLILSFVKQMQFDVVILGKKMFTDDKKQNLRNQIDFYKQGFGKSMNDEQAYQELIMLSTSSPQFVTLLKETCYFFIGKNLEIEAQINKELNRSITHIESFLGNIKIEYKQIIVNWSVSRQKLYSKTVVDILFRSFLLSYMLEIVIRSAIKLDFKFTFQISIEYTQSCLEKEIEPKFLIEDQASSYEFKFYK